MRALLAYEGGKAFKERQRRNSEEYRRKVGREGGRGWTKGGCERSDRRRRVGGEAGERMEDLGRVSESYQRLLSLLLGIQPK